MLSHRLLSLSLTLFSVSSRLVPVFVVYKSLGIPSNPSERSFLQTTTTKKPILLLIMYIGWWWGVCSCDCRCLKNPEKSDSSGIGATGGS